MKKVPLYAKILAGMVLGIAWGFMAILTGLNEFTLNFISPLGSIFVNLLTLIAIPLVISSLIVGVSSLSDIQKLSKIGGKTIAIYISVTALAVSIGLLTVNIIEPGLYFSEELRESMQQEQAKEAEARIETAEAEKERRPLDTLVRIVPQNLFSALSDNANMLQVVFFAIFFGLTLILIPDEKAKPVYNFFVGINEVMVKMVSLIMMAAPVGVFGLMAGMLPELAGDDTAAAVDLLGGIGVYAITLIIALAVMILVVYPLMLKLFTRQSIKGFFKAIFPVQLLAFSTSSSAATLPVTMQRVEEKLGVSKEVSSFVLPLGATINMDGTSIYQAVAAVFIAQAFGVDLSFTQMLQIVLTATLASVGTAGVPGAGIIMLVIVLNSIGVDPAGIALILAVDRPLDMCRTMVNVTGDATVASIIDKTESKD